MGSPNNDPVMSATPGQGADYVAGDWPIRQRSAKGLPKPFSPITRRCARCGACFLGLAAGKTGERGIWAHDLTWYCSQECAPNDT